VVKFREHRGLFEDAMKTVVEVADRTALIEHLRKVYDDGMPMPDLEKMVIEYYCYDDRIGWDTYIIYVKNYGVLGFSDGPI